MLTNKVSIDDRFSQVQLLTQKRTSGTSGILNKFYVTFEGENAGLRKMRSDRYALENNIFPIAITEAKFQYL